MGPADVIADETMRAAGANYVGIGATVLPLLETRTGSVIVVWPNSAAAEAGLRPHDLLLEVDGLPFYDDARVGRSRGV
ncbi:MAG: PDZ domain-containing protein [Anaerolineaceae bacterium]